MYASLVLDDENMLLTFIVTVYTLTGKVTEYEDVNDENMDCKY